MLKVETTHRVQQMFEQFMLNTKKVDKKLVGYWVQSIDSGDKSLEDFKTFLTNSHDYKQAVKNKFIDIFYDKLSDTDYHSAYEQFVIEKEGEVVEENDIVDYITNSLQFVEKYTAIILALYETLIGVSPTNEHVSFYVKKFQESGEYDIDSLRNDIEKRIHEIDACKNENGSEEVEESSVAHHIIQKLNSVSEEVLSNIMKLLEGNNGVEENKQHESTSKGVENDSEKDEQLINDFEKVFGRSMEARELLYYKERLSNSSSDSISHQESFQNYKSKFTTLYEQISVVLKQYLDEDIDECAFIKRFLTHLDDDEFLQSFSHDIIYSPDYEKKMKERVNSLYKHLYDETMEQDDEEYVFSRVKDKCYKLFDDSLNNEIVEYKNYIDSIGERVLHIFMKTLEREPDKTEASKFLKMYRKQADSVPCEMVEDEITNELRDSLEYHDIIKNRIKKIYNKVHDNMPHASIIYSVLKRIITENDHLSKNMDEIIEKHITEA